MTALPGSMLALSEPGFFASPPVQVALVVGGVVAIVSGAVGVFTVMRGQSFAGHSLSDIGAAGGSAAFLLGINPVLGFLGMGVLAAGTMELIGIRRPRGRDLSAGIVLGAALGLAALFLYFDTTTSSTTGAAIDVLFGSIFALSPSTVPLVVGLSLVALCLIAILYRPLVLSSVSAELATVRGVPIRLVGIGYLLALVVAVSLSAVTIGAILATALLIGPAATALRLTKRTGLAMLLAGAIGVCTTWLGVVLAYYSYYWTPQHYSWPVSFFVVSLTFVFYLAAQVVPTRRAPVTPKAA